MASLIYNSSLDDLAKGNIDYNTDTFYLLLVTNAYSPNKDTHTKRSNITNEVTGTGYTAGGQAVVPTVTLDNANDRLDISWASVTWAAATITARAGVIYKRRGGVASADELVAYVDFLSDIVSTVGDFAVNFLTPYRFQN